MYPTNFEKLRNDWKWDGETISKTNRYLYQLEASYFFFFKILLNFVLPQRNHTQASNGDN